MTKETDKSKKVAVPEEQTVQRVPPTQEQLKIVNRILTSGVSTSTNLKTNVEKEANKKRCYAALGLANSASKDDIKKAYRTIVSLIHPDRITLTNTILDNKQRERFEEAIRLIGEANQILSSDSEDSAQVSVDINPLLDVANYDVQDTEAAAQQAETARDTAYHAIQLNPQTQKITPKNIYTVRDTLCRLKNTEAHHPHLLSSNLYEIDEYIRDIEHKITIKSSWVKQGRKLAFPYLAGRIASAKEAATKCAEMTQQVANYIPASNSNEQAKKYAAALATHYTELARKYATFAKECYNEAIVAVQREKILASSDAFLSISADIFDNASDFANQMRKIASADRKITGLSLSQTLLLYAAAQNSNLELYTLSRRYESSMKPNEKATELKRKEQLAWQYSVHFCGYALDYKEFKGRLNRNVGLIWDQTEKLIDTLFPAEQELLHAEQKDKPLVLGPSSGSSIDLLPTMSPAEKFAKLQQGLSYLYDIAFYDKLNIFANIYSLWIKPLEEKIASLGNDQTVRPHLQVILDENKNLIRAHVEDHLEAFYKDPDANNLFLQKDKAEQFRTDLNRKLLDLNWSVNTQPIAANAALTNPSIQPIVTTSHATVAEAPKPIPSTPVNNTFVAGSVVSPAKVTKKSAPVEKFDPAESTPKERVQHAMQEIKPRSEVGMWVRYLFWGFINTITLTVARRLSNTVDDALAWRTKTEKILETGHSKFVYIQNAEDKYRKRSEAELANAKAALEAEEKARTAKGTWKQSDLSIDASGLHKSVVEGNSALTIGAADSSSDNVSSNSSNQGSPSSAVNALNMAAAYGNLNQSTTNTNKTDEDKHSNSSGSRSRSASPTPSSASSTD